MFGATATFFLALSLLPLAEVSTLASTTPLIDHRAGRAAPRRARPPPDQIVGAVDRIRGVLILVGIDPAGIDAGRRSCRSATATSYALFSLLTRELRAEPPDVTLFYSGVGGDDRGDGPVRGRAEASRRQSRGNGSAIADRRSGRADRSPAAGRRLSLGSCQRLAPLGYLGLVWSFIIGAIGVRRAGRAAAILGAVAITDRRAHRAAEPGRTRASRRPGLGRLRRSGRPRRRTASAAPSATATRAAAGPSAPEPGAMRVASRSGLARGRRSAPPRQLRHPVPVAEVRVALGELPRGRDVAGRRTRRSRAPGRTRRAGAPGPAAGTRRTTRRAGARRRPARGRARAGRSAGRSRDPRRQLSPSAARHWPNGLGSVASRVGRARRAVSRGRRAARTCRGTIGSAPASSGYRSVAAQASAMARSRSGPRARRGCRATRRCTCPAVTLPLQPEA